MNVNYAKQADILTVHREIVRRLRKNGIRAEYQEGIDTAYATRNSVVLPVLPAPITTEALLWNRYAVVHEIGHHHRPAVFDILEKHRPSQKLAYINNLIEDCVQEQVTAARAYGDRKLLMQGRSLVHIPRMITNIKDALSSHGKDALAEDQVKATAAFFCIELGRKSYDPAIADKVAGWLRELSLTMLTDWFTTLCSEGWQNKLTRDKDELAVWDISVDLFKRLYPDEPESEPEDGEGGGESGDGDPDDGDETEGQADGCIIPWDKLGTMPDHDGEYNPDGGEIIIDYAGWSPSRDFQFYPESKVEVRRLRTSSTCVPDYDTGVANQLRRYVQSLCRKGWKNEQRHGKINRRALKRVAMGTGDYNRRVFRKPTETKTENVSLTLLVDASGSMHSRDRYECASIAAAMLTDCFAKTLRVPVEVLSHTETGNVQIGVAKSFDEHVCGKTVYRRLQSEGLCGNADGDALLEAARRLRKRRESRRIIVMLSDGQPADAYDGDAGSVLHSAIEIVRSWGIEVYGIGINHVNLKTWFGEHTQNVENPQVLPQRVLETAKRFVQPKRTR